MFQSMQQQRRSNDNAAAVDIAPLIDIVFILLIFFLVTTTFVRDRGIDVTRPQATHAQTLEPEALRVHVTDAGNVFVDGRAAQLAQVAAKVREFVQRAPDASVIVVPDEKVEARTLVDVMDRVKDGGAKQVALATRRKGGA